MRSTQSVDGDSRGTTLKSRDGWEDKGWVEGGWSAMMMSGQTDWQDWLKGPGNGTGTSVSFKVIFMKRFHTSAGPPCHHDHKRVASRGAVSPFGRTLELEGQATNDRSGHLCQILAKRTCQ